jgi:DNA-binding protein WhiA
MTYVKSAEMISDMIRLLGATNSFFYFEDIRIYRDHKNMVNRLNNCELANQEKVLKTGLKQLEDINYLKEHDLVDLLDENVREAIRYREAYPETSLAELADIISQETGRQIGKSGINHYFIKVNKLVEKHKDKTNV